MGDGNTCPIAPVCKLKGVFVEAREAFLEVLDAYLLEDMIVEPDKLRSLLSMSSAS